MPRASLVFLVLAGCSKGAGDLPDRLPFSFERPDQGDPVSDEEIEAFSRRVAAFWKRTDYFGWVLSVSHGVDASTGLSDYSVWWQDIEAIKAGDRVTFRHTEQGGGKN